MTGPDIGKGCDLFISHVEEDEDVARSLTSELALRGYRTWIYEENKLVGVSYLEWIVKALKECRAMILFLSPATLRSNQVDREITTALENGKKILPVLKGIDYGAVKATRPTWCHAFGSALAIPIPQEGISGLAPQIVAGLEALGVVPTSAEIHAPEGRINLPLPAGTESRKSSMHAPPFHCGSVVPPDYYIDREEELLQAEDLIRAHQSFLLVGDLRSGKTSLCKKLIHGMLVRGEKSSLPVYVNLQQCLNLDRGTFLSHALLNMVGEASRVVFGRKYTEMIGRAQGGPDPTENLDACFREFVSVFRSVYRLTHMDSNAGATPVHGPDFIRMTNDLAEVISEKGWGGVTVFFDEANKLPGNLPVDLLVSNEEQLAASHVASVYMANTSMIGFFDPLLQTFGNRIALLPFRTVGEMQQLLARYYWGDISRTKDVPITPQANDLLWAVTQGKPYAIQLIASRSFAFALAEGESFVGDRHVRLARDRVAKEHPELDASGG